MGRYGTLRGTEAFLTRFPKLDPTRQEKAEAHADNWIDRRLWEFDPQQFANEDVPAQIAEIWENVACARYLELEASFRGSPIVEGEETLPGSLRSEAQGIVDEILSQGFVLGVDGKTKVEKKDKSGPRAGSIQVDIRV